MTAAADQEFYDKLRKGKKGLSQSMQIWTISFLLAFGMITIGVVDYFADYEIESVDANNIPLQDVSAVDEAEETTITNPANGEEVVLNLFPWETVIYNESGDKNATILKQPIFGFFTYRKVDGGFLPANINLTVHDWIILGFMVFLGIPSVMLYQREGRRLKGIDLNLPALLREIADSQRIGMHLPRAIAEAAKRNYGPITEELKKLAAKVSWGIPFRDAMMAFRETLDTPLAKQATILILEAERSGGELEKIFDAAKDYVQELLDIKKERENAITPYIYIVFVSYLIFTVVIFVLFTTFFAPFGVNPTTIDQKLIITVPLAAFKVAFLYMLISQAFFSGLVAGKMGKGSVKLGLYYSTILMAIGLFVHKFLIIPAVENIENAP
ncbi:MAG: type II secretion system F family protein [Candidatus Heimdallarchaeota archaeon]|nr:type II secretion system F family protein [Candidatus Heimdallarchaeota archaeon]